MTRALNHPGSSANRAGKLFEGMTADLLRRMRLSYIHQHRLAIRDEMHREPKVDFLVNGLPGFPNGLYLQCKWQASDGSMDRKIVAEARTIAEHYDRRTVLLLGGSRATAVIPQCQAFRNDVLLEILRLDEFAEWCLNSITNKPHTSIKKAYDACQGVLFK